VMCQQILPARAARRALPCSAMRKPDRDAQIGTPGRRAAGERCSRRLCLARGTACHDVALAPRPAGLPSHEDPVGHAGHAPCL